MKDPVDTIRRLRIFSNKIVEGYYRPNFVLSEGYLKFLDDLHKEAMMLAHACSMQLTGIIEGEPEEKQEKYETDLSA